MLKKGIISILMLATAHVLLSQNWCPPGASWEYDAGCLECSAKFNLKYEKNTTIDGQVCKVIRVDERCLNGIYPGSYFKHFTYSENDSVFFYFDGAFRLVYDFTVQLGDTIVQSNLNGQFYDCGNTIYWLVDSIGKQFIDGDSLRYYELSYTDSVHMKTLRLKVLEKYGALNNSIIPWDDCLGLIDNCYMTLACYDDNSQSSYRNDTMVGCRYTSVPQLTGTNDPTLNLYPNPAQNQLILETNQSSYSYSVHNIYGQQMQAGTRGRLIQKIDISSYATGIYFINLSLASGQSATRRFVKR